MNGNIFVDSQIGKGSRFTVILPLVYTGEEVIGKVDSWEVLDIEADIDKNSVLIAPDKKLLLVDDNEMNCRVVTNLLKRTQIQVDVARSGKECILALQGKKQYDIIFLDHMMPGMDGIETFHRLVELPEYEKNPIPVIALTENAIKGEKERYLSQGFDDYLSKPISFQDMENLLEKYLDEDDIYANAKSEPLYRIESEQENKLKEYEEKGIDTKKGLLYADNNVDFYIEMMEDFQKEADKLQQKWEEIFIKEEYHSLQIAAHSLKNNCASLGMEKLKEMAYQLEMLTKKQQENGMEEEQIRQVYNDILNAIHEIV